LAPGSGQADTIGLGAPIPNDLLRPGALPFRNMPASNAAQVPIVPLMRRQAARLFATAHARIAAVRSEDRCLSY